MTAAVAETQFGVVPRLKCIARAIEHRDMLVLLAVQPTRSVRDSHDPTAQPQAALVRVTFAPHEGGRYSAGTGEMFIDCGGFA